MTGVVFSPDGEQLASASEDRTVKVWDARTGKETLKLKGHLHYLRSLSFSPDGSRLATGGTDTTVRVWSMSTGWETFTLTGHTATVLGVSFSPDGTQLMSTGKDFTFKVWDARPWTPALRAKSQARSMLLTLRNQVDSLETLKQTIDEDLSISDQVRKQANEWAELFWQNRRRARR